MRAGIAGAILLTAAGGVGVVSALSAGAIDPDEQQACRVTRPNGRVPLVYGLPARDAGVNHGNGKLYVGLWRDGRVTVPARAAHPDGSIDAKFAWWRGVPGRLRIAAIRLDAAAPPARLSIPAGYGRKFFQATGIVFPTTGCWRVTGTVGRLARLTFVTRVAVAPG